MDHSLFRSLLSKEFFLANKQHLRPSLFEDELRDIYELLADGFEKYNQDLTVPEVTQLWKAANPISTPAQEEAIEDVLTEILDADPISQAVASDVVQGLWQRQFGQKIANCGIQIAEGKNDAFKRLETMMVENRAGFLPTDFGDAVTSDIDELLSADAEKFKWEINLSALADNFPGIGPESFGIIFATPETGKTSSAVSLMCAPGGFASQGAKCLYLGNEESPRRTQLRAIQCYTNATKEEVIAAPTRHAELYRTIRDNIVMHDIQGWDLDKVEAYIDHVNPDVVFIDQLDKVHLQGNFSAPHERLRELYLRTRELAKTYDTAIIGMSQASDGARGNTILSPHDMEGSKIGKQAEADYIIGIGKQGEDHDDPARYWTLGKNKLTGWHGTVCVNLDHITGRYSD